MLGELVLEVLAKYKNDPSAPSVTISYIVSKRKWYISICRYHKKYGECKEVVFNTYSHFLFWGVLKLWFKFRVLKNVPL